MDGSDSWKVNVRTRSSSADEIPDALMSDICEQTGVILQLDNRIKLTFSLNCQVLDSNVEC
jgi:hypothetical protein